MSSKQDLTVLQGKTFTRVVRWETLPFVYKAIAGITNAAPAVVTTTPDHGVIDGWRVAIVSVKGMDEINATEPTPKDREFTKATVTGAKTLELNAVNTADFGKYISGGYVQYYTPVDLNGYVGRMQIRDRAGGTLLASTDPADAPLNVISVVVDNAYKKITVSIPAASTAAFAWKKGVYELEMVSGSGDVTALLSGNITVTPEVTTATA